MPIYELEPEFKIGPIKFSTKVGPEIKQFPYDITLTSHVDSPGAEHGWGKFIKVEDPENIIVGRWFGVGEYDETTINHLKGPEINSNPLTKGRLRWRPA